MKQALQTMRTVPRLASRGNTPRGVAAPGESIPLGPDSRRHCPASSPGPTEDDRGFASQAVFVGPQAAVPLVVPSRLASPGAVVMEQEH